MVAHLRESWKEMLSILFDHIPALCFWANRNWCLRAIELRFRTTVDISFQHSLRCATITREIKNVLQRKLISRTFHSKELFAISV